MFIVIWLKKSLTLNNNCGYNDIIFTIIKKSIVHLTSIPRHLRQIAGDNKFPVHYYNAALYGIQFLQVLTKLFHRKFISDKIFCLFIPMVDPRRIVSNGVQLALFETCTIFGCSSPGMVSGKLKYSYLSPIKEFNTLSSF